MVSVVETKSTVAQCVSGMNILADVARHALPLVSLYRLQGSIPGYLLLTAFDLRSASW